MQYELLINRFIEVMTSDLPEALKMDDLKELLRDAQELKQTGASPSNRLDL